MSSSRTGTKIDTALFYRFGPVLSRNAVYNFVVGGRGLGKTFGAKEQGIRNWESRGEHMVYLRRYTKELGARSTFFADVAHKFPHLGFRIHGMTAQVTRNPADKNPEWHTFVYFVALSTSAQKKSVSYDRVTLIVYDEFIIEKGVVRYLPHELRVFNDFYSTVDRYKDKTCVLFLANSVSIMNPFFDGLGIEVTGSEWIKAHDGFVVAHFPKAADFVNAVKQTRYGQFIDGTEYGEYAMGNVFRDNNGALIGPKTPSAVYLFTIEGSTGSMAIWRDSFAFGGEVGYFAQVKQPKNPAILTLDASRMREGVQLLTRGDKLSAILRTAFNKGRVIFDRPSTRNTFIELFNYN